MVDRVSWRRLIPSEPEGAPLALGVELRQRTPRADAHWGPRRYEPATPRALARSTDDLALGVRPLVRGAADSWVKGDVSWDAVRRTPERFAAAQARWFAELYSIAHDTGPTGPFTAVAEWLLLDGANSSLLLGHLASAAALGIPIVPTHRQQRVQLRAPAEARIDLVRVGDDLRVSAVLTLDGEHLDAGLVRPIGTTGVYTIDVHRDPVPIRIVPVDLTAPLAELLTTPEGMLVPAGDVDEFLREAYPQLARSAIVAADPAIELPAPRGLAARITVTFAEDETLAYTCVWAVEGRPATPWDAIAPDRADEQARLRARIDDVVARAGGAPLRARGTLRSEDALGFVTDVLPALEQTEGVRVRTSGRRPALTELLGDPRIRITAVESADPDWFDLGVQLSIDGRPVAFGTLVSALARGRARIRLADGAFFSLRHPALERLKELLDESAALAEWETGPRLHRTQMSLWADFEDVADESEPAVAWRALVRAIDAPPEPVAVPPGIRAELRPYQRDGLAWLAFLRRQRLGGILADDMGLGKTLQVLSLIAHAGAQEPFLVVAPTSVLSSWREQAAHFAPDLDVRVVDVTPERSGRPLSDAARGADVVLTSYAVLRLADDAFAAEEWAGVVLDEAQQVKNPATRVHRAAKRLRAPSVIAVTGTPLENSLTDLWALLSLTAPGLFPSARRFRDEYVQPIERGRIPEHVDGGTYRTARIERLRRRIRPFVLRRTKELVAPELPARQEQDLLVELSPAHRALYDTALQRERQKVLGLLDDLDRTRFIVFRSLTLLRLMSLAPALVDERHARVGSAKLDALVDHIAEIAAEGHRALVFSQFTSFLDIVQAHLATDGLSAVRLDGATTRRGEVIDAFREGDDPVFLLSLKAGGVGLTLTEADYVFLLDPWWTPAAEAQAIDRTHRIGQEQTVFVYRLIAADTIEEKVRALQHRKQALFDAVLNDDETLARQLTADDIRELLS